MTVGFELRLTYDILDQVKIASQDVNKRPHRILRSQTARVES